MTIPAQATVACPCGISFSVETNGLVLFQCNCPECGQTLQADLASPPAPAKQTGPENQASLESNPIADERFTILNCRCGKKLKVDSLGKTDFHATCPTCKTQLRVGSPKAKKKKSKLAPKAAVLSTGNSKPVVTCNCGRTFQVDTPQKDFRCHCPDCNKLIEVGNPPKPIPKPPSPMASQLSPIVANPLGDPYSSENPYTQNPVPAPRPAPKPKTKKRKKKKQKNQQERGVLGVLLDWIWIFLVLFIVIVRVLAVAFRVSEN